MKVLVVGSGGREHALIWKISQSPLAEKIYSAPGNAGIASSAERLPMKADDTEGLLRFAEEKEIDLTVIGPEAPLVGGIADRFMKNRKRIFGFTEKGARLEGSKVWAKEFMKRNKIPTGYFRTFDDMPEALGYLDGIDFPCVIKADGLAAGKGVLICDDRREAVEALERIMKERSFGNAGERVIIEEFLKGKEISILSVFDGRDYRMLVPSQDHKRAYDGDRGPNTGGMGAYAPVPFYDARLEKLIIDEIVEPTFSGMKREGIAESAGVLYFGLMITDEGPKMLEYNCRFGDPETQVVLPLLKTDLLELAFESAGGDLSSVEFSNSKDSAVCVVVASGGYPGSYSKGFEITGIEKAEESGCMVFHAGTEFKEDRVITSGGRVLGVTAVAHEFSQALQKAYEGVDLISFSDCFSRRDIGRKALE